MHPDFELRLLDLHWLVDDAPQVDLCAHGHVRVRIGSDIVADASSLDVTVSATALYLLRSLTTDFIPHQQASQLLPCCGHYWFLEENNPLVLLMGCANGIDWSIIHTPNQHVRHVAESGQEAIIPFAVYQQLVLNFADQVEQFYASSQPKILPVDEDDRRAYLAYWAEWRNLRDKWAT